MAFSVFYSILEPITSRWPLLLYAALWTAILTAVVAVASFAPEIAFVSAITPTSSFSKACGEAEGSVRVPLDVPAAVTCFPAQMFRRSKMDLLVPPVFAAIIVAGSACAVRALGLWEADADADAAH